MKLLALSDTEIGFLYSPLVRDRFSDVDIVISCGDLPYFYLEFIVSMLNVPMFFVHGNHANQVEFGSTGIRTSPWGAVNLDQRVIEDETGLILVGLEGSLQYNQGPHQYTQRQYWQKVFSLVPRLMINKARVGRYLDVFVTHAPPWKIHDMDDLPHRGIKAFKWLIDVFQPAFHLHGHIHIYRQDTIMKTTVGTTQVLNVYGYREITMPFPQKRSWMKTRI
jgi:Icc-related predicted phosphoesterase